MVNPGYPRQNIRILTFFHGITSKPTLPRPSLQKTKH
jgi:hypothetical protein